LLSRARGNLRDILEPYIEKGMLTGEPGKQPGKSHVDSGD